MTRSRFFIHLLLLAAVAVYSAEAGSCYFGRWACYLSCVAQNCATGYCTSRSSICRCSRCGTGPSPILTGRGKRDTEDITEPLFAGIQQGQPAQPQEGKTFSVSQSVDIEQLMNIFDDEEIQTRFRLLNFDIITVHETILEGWGSNRNRSSEDFGILHKHIATKEEGLQLLDELADILSEVLGEETKDTLKNFLLSQEDPQPKNDRSKRYDLGGGFYGDLFPPRIGWRGGGWDISLRPTYSGGGIGGSLNIGFRF